jgi:hypothetical protein
MLGTDRPNPALHWTAAAYNDTRRSSIGRRNKRVADEEVPSRFGIGTLEQRQQLLFVRHPKRGWYFEYSTSNMPERRWVVRLQAAADRGKYVKHWACGEQLRFLAGSFVDRPAAERVVLDFLATKQPSAVVPWADFATVRPRLDEDQYRELRRAKRDRAEPGVTGDSPRDGKNGQDDRDLA